MQYNEHPPIVDPVITYSTQGARPGRARILFAAFFLLYGASGVLVQARSNPGRETFDTHTDYYHTLISLRIIDFADRLDRFFADDRILEETDETLIRITPSINVTERRGSTVRLSVSGRLALPYMEERWQIFVDRIGAGRDIREEFSETPDTTEDDKSLFAGVRYLARETRRSRLDLDGGLRWRRGPNPFARIRGRRYIHLDPWLMRLTQTFFWFEHRGFGMTPAVDFDRRLLEHIFFRSTSSGTWAEDSQGVDIRQQFSFVHRLSERRAVGFSAHAYGHTHPSLVMDEYGLIWRYRQRIHRDWLFLEIAPGTLFPRDRDYELTPTVTVKLEAFFGDIRQIGADSPSRR